MRRAPPSGLLKDYTRWQRMGPCPLHILYFLKQLLRVILTTVWYLLLRKIKPRNIKEKMDKEDKEIPKDKFIKMISKDLLHLWCQKYTYSWL